MKRNVDFTENDRLFTDTLIIPANERFTIFVNPGQDCLVELKIAAKKDVSFGSANVSK